MSKTLLGTRVNDNIIPLNKGEYSKQNNGDWLLCLPTGIHGRINNKWNIIEHENNTITVSPSINTTCPDPNYNWHGWLENGIWREA